MPDKVLPGPVHGGAPCVKEAVCIHTKRVYDSCRDKECIEDLRVYPTRASQDIIDRSINVKCRSTDLIWVYIDVQEVAFNRGFYTVDVKYFYRVTADAFMCAGRPTEVQGLATFDKRVILFGSEGNARIFSSNADNDRIRETTNLPTAVVEVVDPICLSVKLVDVCDCHCGGEETCEIPDGVGDFFNDEIVFGSESKRIYVTLGQFSIIKLERDSQLLIPCYDFCVPDKECVGSSDTDPCDFFSKIKFPIDQFFPPDVRSLEDIEVPKCGC